jgi:hypothetical protein
MSVANCVRKVPILKSLLLTATAIGGFAQFSPALAAENVTFTYDSKGRLVKVVRTGSAQNNGVVTTDYSHDKANNRRNVKVTGSTNTPPP